MLLAFSCPLHCHSQCARKAADHPPVKEAVQELVIHTINHYYHEHLSYLLSEVSCSHLSKLELVSLQTCLCINYIPITFCSSHCDSNS